MKRVLVIGIGSLVMRDDGIGPRVVQAIAGSLRENAVASLVGETDFQCCNEEIEKEDLVILLDAMAKGCEPGSVEVLPLSTALSDRPRLLAQHDGSLMDLLGLRAPQIEGYLIGIEAGDIGFGLNLSEPLEERFGQICSEVLAAILEIKREAEKARF